MRSSAEGNRIVPPPGRDESPVASRRPWVRSRAVMVVVALLIGAVGTLLPLPTFGDEQAMATETRRPLAEGAQVQPAPEEPPVTEEGPVAPEGVESSTTVPPTTTTTQGTTTSGAPTTTVPAPPQPAAADARVVVAEDTRDFDLIGVTLPGAPVTPVLVRTADADGTWTEWTELEFEDIPGEEPAPVAPAPAEPDEGNPGAHSSPLWIGDATRYELDLAAVDAEVAEVHLVYETTRRVVVETQQADAQAGAPSIWGRSHWGARAPRANPTIAPTINASILHHTAGSNYYQPGDVPGILRGIQAYQMDANGWDDIAYNFLVDYWGRIWEGRAGGVTNAVVGAHTRGFNTGNFGVAVLGNFDTAWVSSASLEGVVQIMTWKFAVHDVDPRQDTWVQAGAGSPVYPPGTWIPTPRIFSHRDVGQTACPGGYLYHWLGSIRSEVNARVGGLLVPGQAVMGNFVGSGADDVYSYQPGTMPDTVLAGSAGGFQVVRNYEAGAGFWPVVGDYDGNGYDDIYWYAPGPGADWLWVSDGTSFYASGTAWNGGSQAALVGDFDGDGDDDIYWYAPGPGEDNLWIANQGVFYGAAVPWVSTYHIPVTGDFNGDRKDEILWSGLEYGTVWETFGPGITFYSRRTTKVDGNFMPRTGDYDGDGDDDVMWYWPGGGPDYLWTSQNGQFSVALSPQVDGSFTNLLPGDLDGNGYEDLVWYWAGGDDWWWRSSGGRVFADQGLTNVPLR